jgi:hypothetical protein
MKRFYLNNPRPFLIMNFKFKSPLVLLTGLLLFYAACKKDTKINPKPASVIDTVGAASGQIVKNLAQTLAGTYGGVNISKGLVLPDFTSTHNSKPIILGLFNLCTFFPDTVVSYNTNVADTIKAQTSGLFKFYFSCDTLKAPRVRGYPVFSNLNGYAAYDSLATNGSSPRATFVYNIKAFYEAKVLDSLNTNLIINGGANSLISFNGSIKSFVDSTATKKGVPSSSVHAYYVLHDVVVDLSKKGDITQGTATFGAIGETNGVKWYYTGTIKFLGDHKVSIIIRNKTYTVDLLTGKTVII